MKKKLIISGVIVLIIIAGLITWEVTKSGSKPTGSTGATLPTVKVDRGTIEKVVFAKGVIAESGRQEVKTEVRSKVTRIIVKPGDPVKAGDLLFTMDEGNARLMLEQEQLINQGKVQNLNSIKQKTNSDKVVSPVAGKLSKWLVKEGDRVQEYTPVAEITDPDFLEATAPFGPVGFERLRVGQKVKVIPADTWSYVEATVTKLDQKERAEVGGGIVHDVTVRFKNPGAVAVGEKVTVEVNFSDGSSIQSFYNQGVVQIMEPVKVRSGTIGRVEKLEFDEGDLINRQSSLLRLNISDESQQLKESELALKQSQLALKIKQNELAKYQVIADQDGVVTEVNLIVGQEPPGDKPSIVLSNINGLELRAKVEESDVPFIHVGQQATVYAIAFGDRAFPAIITEIARVGKNEGNTVVFETKIKIKEAGPLSVGMTGDVDIIVEKREGVLRLPLSTVSIDGRKGTIMVKGPNGPTPQEVRLGLEGEDYIEILSGLKEGNEVLVNPATRK